MQIVRATIEDIPKIVECAREYTSIIPDVDYDEAHYLKFWESMMTAGVGVMFLLMDGVRVVGGIGGVKFPEALSGKITAVEMFWYTLETHRRGGVSLYRTFEQWAKDEGCKRLAMIYLPCSMPEKLHQFYESQGFTLLEMHYQKEIKP